MHRTDESPVAVHRGCGAISLYESSSLSKAFFVSKDPCFPYNKGVLVILSATTVDKECQRRDQESRQGAPLGESVGSALCPFMPLPETHLSPQRGTLTLLAIVRKNYEGDSPK